MTLKLLYKIDLPQHSTGDFDHADIHKKSNKIFVAHTANGTVEIIDGSKKKHIGTISDCSEASGVLCAQENDLVFAASRGSGRVLIIDAIKNTYISEIKVSPSPNGIAWDSIREKLLVADVKENNLLLIDFKSKSITNKIPLAGRPRWCIYNSKLKKFFVNIREPAGIAIISPETGVQEKFISISQAGPHGLDIDMDSQEAYIACDAKSLVVLDLAKDQEKTIIPLSGAPDVIWLNKKKNLLYCASSNPGIVDVIHTKSYRLIEKMPTEIGAHTLTFNPETQQLFVFLPKTCCASVYKEE